LQTTVHIGRQKPRNIGDTPKSRVKQVLGVTSVAEEEVRWRKNKGV
jgi:hypothetical protein